MRRWWQAGKFKLYCKKCFKYYCPFEERGLVKIDPYYWIEGEIYYMYVPIRPISLEFFKKLKGITE